MSNFEIHILTYMEQDEKQIIKLLGNYLKTLETGYQILKLCYDDEHHRLILFSYNEMQFGYLDLEGIV